MAWIRKHWADAAMFVILTVGLIATAVTAMMIAHRLGANDVRTGMVGGVMLVGLPRLVSWLVGKSAL